MTLQLRGVVAEFNHDVGLGVVDVDGVAMQFHCIAISDGSRNIEVGTAVTVATERRFGRIEAVRVTPQLA